MPPALDLKQDGQDLDGRDFADGAIAQGGRQVLEKPAPLVDGHTRLLLPLQLGEKLVGDQAKGGGPAELGGRLCEAALARRVAACSQRVAVWASRTSDNPTIG